MYWMWLVNWSQKYKSKVIITNLATRIKSMFPVYLLSFRFRMAQKCSHLFLLLVIYNIFTCFLELHVGLDQRPGITYEFSVPQIIGGWVLKSCSWGIGEKICHHLRITIKNRLSSQSNSCLKTTVKVPRKIIAHNQ